MIKEPKTIEEKIQYLKDIAPYITNKSGMIIYGQYNLRENYYLRSDGMISIRKWISGKPTNRIKVEIFAEKCGEEGLDYAIGQIKLKVRVPENPP
jgi:hypothetical protein